MIAIENSPEQAASQTTFLGPRITPEPGSASRSNQPDGLMFRWRKVLEGILGKLQKDFVYTDAISCSRLSLISAGDESVVVWKYVISRIIWRI
ncbi:hypothetical protein [Roseibium sp.]|uniref:hypothetical protein n=1 Tax=Roseibium sp. TaxID=1936156 RepID=UPI003B51FC43